MTRPLGLGRALFQVCIVAGALAGTAAACGSNGADLPYGGGTGGSDSGNGKDGGPGSNNDGPATIGNDGAGPIDGSMDCSQGSANMMGCQCQVGDMPRACYDGPANTKGVGSCKAGTQACVQQGEFSKYGPCMGEVTPMPDPNHCTDGMDTECTGLIGCKDPACANTPGCAPPPPDASMPPPPPQDAGCTPPITTITGAQRCPDGTILNQNTNLCCPCTVNDCPGSGMVLFDAFVIPGGNYACCSSPVCAGSSGCSMCPSMVLDPACNGMVDGDCDDFPEDCDQLCCPCKPAQCGRCPQGQVMCCPTGTSGCDPNDPMQVNWVCTNVATSPATCGACDFTCNTGQQCVGGLCM